MLLGEVALQLSRVALLSLFHGLHGSLHNGTAGQRHQLGRVRIGDAVAQSAIGACVRVIEGQRPHAGHAVPGPGAQTPGAILRLYRHSGDGKAFAVPAQAHGCRRSAGGLQQSLQFLGGRDPFAVAADDQVPLLYAAVTGRARTVAGGRHHQHAIGKQLDAHRLPHRDQGALGPGEQHGQQPCGRPAYASLFLRFIHAITPVFEFCRRRQSYFARIARLSCPLNIGCISAAGKKSAADSSLRRKAGKNFKYHRIS